MKDSFLQILKKYTSASETDLKEALKVIPIGVFKKGTLLIRQGEVPRFCYYIFEGCIRQYSIDEGGMEVTSEIYTEHQAVVVFSEEGYMEASPFFIECLEDCQLLVGDLSQETDMFDAYPFLKELVLKMVEAGMAAMIKQHAAFVSANPEQRYINLLAQRPELFSRVPKYQLASYLGMTPESFSRIRRRVESGLKAVD